MSLTKNYTDGTIISAESARVYFVTCKKCGAAILLDPRETLDVIKLHDDFHINDTKTK